MFDLLASHGLVPVIKVDRAEDALPLCRALKKGGLPVAEITLRSPTALEAIRLVAREEPDILLGAGTVLDIPQAEAAMEAGAGFLVSPGLSQGLMAHCRKQGWPYLPGCGGPGDVQAAYEAGYSTLKLFPAEVLGGPDMIKALLGPYAMMRFVPTGGISLSNIADYLVIPQVLACGGSWMVPQAAIQSQHWEQITALCAQAVEKIKELRPRKEA